MKNTLYLISNEKIFQNNEMFFCDNLDMKSTPEGLNKKFEINLFGRKTNIKNQPIIEIYNDGSVKKKVIIE